MYPPALVDVLHTSSLSSGAKLGYLGYELRSLSKTTHGLTASLVLGGKPCNTYGTDIEHLTVDVAYETQSRLALTSLNIIGN